MKKIFLILLFIILTCNPVMSEKYSVGGKIPSGTTLPDTCEQGEQFIDTDADTDGQLYFCNEEDSWKEVSSTGGGTPDAHSDSHDIDGSDPVNRLFKTEYGLWEQFTDTDATPEVEAFHSYYSGDNSAVRITDFVDADGDYSDFSLGDSIIVLWDSPDVILGCQDNSQIICNAGVDFIGSSTYITPIIFMFDGDEWIAINLLWGHSDPTTLVVSSISINTLYTDDELNDIDGDPYNLITKECMGTILSNGDSIGADTWNFPAMTEGWNFIFVIEVAQNVTLQPNGTEAWWLNGTQLSAGEAIVNESPSIGESITCYSTGIYVFCESKYSDWMEDTP